MRKLAIANSHAVGVLDGSTTSSPGPSARRDRVGSDSSGEWVLSLVSAQSEHGEVGLL